MTRKLGLAATVAAVAAAVGGGTFAFFVDQDEVQANQIEGGTLSIALASGTNMSDSLEPWTMTGMAPRISETRDEVKKVIVRNTGNVPGIVSFQAFDLVDRDNGCNEPESEEDSSCTDDPTAAGELSRHLTALISERKVVWDDDDDLYRCSSNPGREIRDSLTLADLASGQEFGGDPNNRVIVEGNDQVCLAFRFYLPEETTNIVQSDSSQFKMRFVLRTG